LSVGQRIRQVPLADYVDGTGVELVIASVTGIDPGARELTLADGRGGRRAMRYDTLVYALGSNIDLTSVRGVAEHCHTLTGTSSADELRTRLSALAETGGEVVVCGGGATGIETVTEIAERYPGIRTRLVSAGVPGGWLSEKGRTYLDDTLAELAIPVVAGARVDHVEEGVLLLVDGGRVPFDLCVWAGGFSVPELAGDSGLPVNSTGRIVVDPTFRAVGHPDVYAIGDAAAIAGRWGEELAMGCRTGGFTGPRLADIIAARLTGRAAKPFRYRYVHECVSLGRGHGLVQFLNADETPKTRILTGRKAIAYKNMTLNSAKLLFRHTGPVAPRRRHLVAAAAAPDGAVTVR
jgi:NADH dehydrogenase FAD-containing subunit